MLNVPAGRHVQITSAPVLRASLIFPGVNALNVLRHLTVPKATNVRQTHVLRALKEKSAVVLREKIPMVPRNLPTGKEAVIRLAVRIYVLRNGRIVTQSALLKGDMDACA